MGTARSMQGSKQQHARLARSMQGEAVYMVVPQSGYGSPVVRQKLKGQSDVGVRPVHR